MRCSITDNEPSEPPFWRRESAAGSPEKLVLLFRSTGVGRWGDARIRMNSVLSWDAEGWYATSRSGLGRGTRSDAGTACGRPDRGPPSTLRSVSVPACAGVTQA